MQGRPHTRASLFTPDDRRPPSQLLDGKRRMFPEPSRRISGCAEKAGSASPCLSLESRALNQTFQPRMGHSCRSSEQGLLLVRS